MATPASVPDTRSARSRRAPRATGDDRERAILETAERLLEERPLHEISVDDLARGAGISRPTFYFYFASKQAVLLTLLDRMVEEARISRGRALERFATEPSRFLHEALTAIYETFRAHRAATLAGADARVTSPEAREMWERVMETFVQETTLAIETERARGAAPDGIPARDLSIALNLMNERVLHATFAGHSPAIEEENVVGVLVALWLQAIYGTTAPEAAQKSR